MSAGHDERLGAAFTRDNITDRAVGLGHTMVWKLAPNSTRKGHCYYFEGVCSDCGATASAGSAWSSSPTATDARRVKCGGPGTAILTEIEHARASELLGEAVAAFGVAVRAAVAHNASLN